MANPNKEFHMLVITQQEYRRREKRKAFARNAFVIVPMITAVVSFAFACVHDFGIRL